MHKVNKIVANDSFRSVVLAPLVLNYRIINGMHKMLKATIPFYLLFAYRYYTTSVGNTSRKSRHNWAFY